MTLKVDATKEQLTGLAAACEKYNADLKDTAVGDDVPAFLSPEDYWNKVYADVSADDGRSEQEVFDAACESYQSHFNVGLGAHAIAALRVTQDEITRAEASEAGAEELKAQYLAQVEAARVASAALIK